MNATAPSWTRFAIAVGIGIAALGLLLDLLPMSVASVSCGSVLFSAANQNDTVNTLCAEKIDSRETLAMVILGLGVVVLTGGAYASTSGRRPVAERENGLQHEDTPGS